MVTIRRLIDSPIIGPEMFGLGGDNINGPSLIHAPDWLPNRLGKFYLYFAHHRGKSIRLAYADHLEGPWTLHEGGTLQLQDVPGCRNHIASPDVHVDDKRQEIRMYFHGIVRGGNEQRTFLATSKDGIAFRAGDQEIDDFYLRVVKWRKRRVGMSKRGTMYISESDTGTFTRLPKSAFETGHPAAREVRHVALKLADDNLEVYFTEVGDMPERIYRATVDLTQPPWQWTATNREIVLEPERPWEGATLPLSPSRGGAAREPENALRDPAIFEWEGKTYMLYSAAGENSIGIAEILESQNGMDRPATAKDTASGKQVEAINAEELKRLQQPGALAQRLAQTDTERPFRRLYVMGCGRSGTWLLTAVISTLGDLEIVPAELPVEHFGLHRTDRSMLVLKRTHDSYKKIEAIPEAIEIAYIVRHPFDVLTSHNPVTKSLFHIPPDRWLGEMLALQYLVDTKRPRTTIIRYEDLVTQPQIAQRGLAAAFGLAINCSTDDMATTFKASPGTIAAMHGIRKIDVNSVNRHRDDPAKLDYLRRIRPRLGRLLQWVSETYNYDITL